MVSNALFIRLLAVWASARLYRSAYSRLYGRRSARRRTKTAWIDRAAAWAAGFLPAQVQLLIVKDLRLFLRDPVYWSQTLIFVGFLLLYFFSIPSIHYEVAQESWVNLVSFLNVSVVGFLLSTFTTRFVFPMISLEGRRFWILGLLPVHRDRILWGKFAFGIGFSVVSSCVLVLVSDSMLRVGAWIFLGHQLTCLILGVGLSGIAVGLGADAQLARAIPVPHRRRVRRDADARAQHSLHSRRGSHDRCPVPFLPRHTEPGVVDPLPRVRIGRQRDAQLARPGYAGQHSAGHRGHGRPSRARFSHSDGWNSDIGKLILWLEVHKHTTHKSIHREQSLVVPPHFSGETAGTCRDYRVGWQVRGSVRPLSVSSEPLESAVKAYPLDVCAVESADAPY